VQKFSKTRDRNLRVGKAIRAFLGKLAQATEDIMIVGGPFDLALEYRKAVALDSRIHEQHVLLQGKKALGRQRDLSDIEFAIAAESDQTSTAISGDDLILIAARFLKDVALEIDGFVRQCLGCAEPSLICIQGLKHGHHKARRRSKARACGKVGHMVQLCPFIYADLLKAGAYCRMTHFRGVERILSFAVSDPKSMIEKLGMKPLNGNVRESIDSRGEHSPTMMLKVLWKIAAAAQKADTNRRLSDDHLRNFPTAAVLRSCTP
jgi:hypothetical protein